jgi:acetylornithine deacetylase/succinyl-diaminopimelate desuccinylase-like protein
MASFLNEQLKAAGVETELVDLGKHQIDGQELPLPPALLGRYGNDKNKKTVLIYGHFDVQPVSFILPGTYSEVILQIISFRLSNLTAGTLTHSSWLNPPMAV